MTSSSRRVRPRVALLAAGVLAVLLAATVTGVRLFDDGEQGSPYPDAWDPRVEKYAEIVEDARGLEFDHPVQVDFLPVETFKEQVTEDDQELTDKDREEIRQAAGLLRALGLLDGEIDLLEALNELRGAGVVGYYSHDDKQIRMRGQELTPDVRSTLVHELTHALQDQHFDLGKRVDELEEADDSAAASAFEALVEGDARRVEAVWRGDLDEDEVAALRRAESQEGRKFADDSAEVPEVLKTMMAAPYVFGEALLRVAVADGGAEAVDAMFETPPTTEEHLLDPWTFVADEEPALEVPEPEPPTEATEFDSGQIGSIGWLLVLAERLPVSQALRAVDGWGGDAYVAYERDDVSCVEAHYRADTDRDLREMRVALVDWTAQLPDARVGSRADGAILTFESCEPSGGSSSEPTGGSRGAVRSAVARTHLSAALAEAGFDAEAARCGAERLLRELTLKELNAPTTQAAQVRRIVAGCVNDGLP